MAECAACQREAALVKDLEQLLASEPAVEVPAELVPGVMRLVRADLARARRNARLAFAGAVAALVALAFGVTFFDLVKGAQGLAGDAVGLAAEARAFAPSAPDVGGGLHFELPTVGYAWAALAVALLIVAAQVKLLGTRRVTA